MQDATPSPAPSKSTGTGGGISAGATSAALATSRAAVIAGMAEEGEKSQDAVMGDLSKVDFQRSINDAVKQMKIDLTSKSDQTPIGTLNSLLKLMASGAMKEVGEHADLLAESMATTATANAAAVTSLESVANWNEKEREKRTDLIDLNKNSSANFSLSEKIFIAAQKSYDDSHRLLCNPQYMKWQPGDCLNQNSNEYQQEVLLSIDVPRDAEESFSKVIDKRILVNKRTCRLESARLKLAKSISPICTIYKMEKDKYAPLPLAQFTEYHTQSAWIAVVNLWLRKPAVLEKYLEIAHDIGFFTNVYDNNKGIYGKAGLGMRIPIMWNDTQKQSDQIGFLRAQKDELLYDEIEALGNTYPLASAASKRGIKTGLDGKTSVLPIKGDGVRRMHLLLLSLGCTRSKDLREVKDGLRLMHEKFTGDTRLGTAIQEVKD